MSDTPSQFRINHVAIVVPDIDAGLAFWRDALGLPVGERKRVAQEAVDIAFLEAGEAHLELVQPISEDSGIAQYLAKKGAGMHHLCLEVDDIEAAMQRLRAHGAQLLNDTPKERDGIRYVFVHPRSTGGVLLELYELPR
ncbi:methylmalonyl-CoA epimerase [Aggregatilineales bacterium SYSU G02658]